MEVRASATSRPGGPLRRPPWPRDVDRGPSLAQLDVFRLSGYRFV